ncbi:MAG: FecR family protein, partial [Methyloglobulus sp.]|nr:FecR family protein [Methyloglobulus sp.]
RAIPGSEPLLQERYPHLQDRNPTNPPKHQGSYRILAIACCILFAISLTFLNPPLSWQADYLTGKGEQRTITLADSSRVMLNTDTSVAIHFDKNLRRVELLEGEAFFEVAKGKPQAFVVTVSGNEVRAVGTAFNVRRDSSQTEVDLVEGIVDLQNSQRQQPTRLQAGQSARISAEGITTKTESSEGMALWRDGYLQFDGLPLKAAIDQINRYRTGHIILLNGEFANKRVSGLFRLNALDQAVDSLKAAVPGIQIRTLTPYLIVLS